LSGRSETSDGVTAIDVKTGMRGRAIVRGGRAAARSAITSLQACLNWAQNHNQIGANPADGVKKIAGAKRERFLSDAEAARLLSAITELQDTGAIAGVFADAFRLLLLTGGRKGEIAGLAWREVDLDRGVIKLGAARGKTGERTIMLSAPATALIAARPRDSAFVLPSPTDAGKPIVGLQKVWARVRARAQLPDLRLHDLRHSFASFAADDGASMAMIAKSLGHTQSRTTERYAHLGDDPVRQLAERVGQRVVAGQAKG
jgi:integrase